MPMVMVAQHCDGSSCHRIICKNALNDEFCMYSISQQKGRKFQRIRKNIAKANANKREHM